jgi:hypothetical protein
VKILARIVNKSMYISATEPIINTPGLVTVEQIESLRKKTLLFLYNNRRKGSQRDVTVIYTFFYFYHPGFNTRDGLASLNVSVDPLSDVGGVKSLRALEQLALVFCPKVKEGEDYTQVIKFVIPPNIPPLVMLKLLSEN